ncbi:MAG: SDR family NAD(P)-dependent oxidoreductase [Clostridia bacterium]|nr:SDR family NAD(P)-dependent oxidoreductase [Clostridia bacterium]
MKKIAIITGASSGMGRSFAVKLDASRSFDEIWLIARRLDKLEELAKELKAPAKCISLDLTDPLSYEEYKKLLEAEKPQVDILVCAAGFGKFGTFTEMPLEPQLRMVDLNVKALVAITYETLPYMTAGGQIYELDSLSSFQPVPYINVYGSTKAFVLSFSRALNVELVKRGIHVMAVSPGWVKTEFFDHAVTDDTIVYYNRYYESDEVVDRALRDMKKGKDLSICGFPVRAQVFFTKLLPHRLIMRIWCKQQKKPF